MFLEDDCCYKVPQFDRYIISIPSNQFKFIKHNHVVCPAFLQAVLYDIEWHMIIFTVWLSHEDMNGKRQKITSVTRVAHAQEEKGTRKN